jgi:hypothetical protein
VLTTFHAVRDLPVALLGITRRIAPANSLTLMEAGEEVERRVSMTCDATDVVFIKFVAIIVLLIEK